MRKFRVPYCGSFFYIRVSGDVLVLRHYERADAMSERLFRSGNYYTTRQGAEAAAERITAILKEQDQQEGGAR